MYKTQNGNIKLLNNFYFNFIMPIKTRFDMGIIFLNQCLEEYYKNLKPGNKSPTGREIEKVKQYKNQLIELESIEIKRFVKLKSTMMKKGDYAIQMKEFITKNAKKLKEHNLLYNMHESYIKKRITYIFDSKLFEKFDYCKSVFKDVNSFTQMELGQAIDNMIREKHDLTSRLYQQMILFIELMKLSFETTTSMLRVNFHTKLKDRYFQFVKAMTLKVDQFHELGKDNPAKEHTEIADKLRESRYFMDLYEIDKFNVENKTLFQKPEWNPFFFQETYEKIEEVESMGPFGSGSISKLNFSSIRQKVRLNTLYHSKVVLTKKQHLVILVHGYQASHYDMRVYQNFISKIIPHSIFLVSKSNEKMEKKRIGQMGEDLAKEIENFVADRKIFNKISFIGHSLGGLIIRSALPHLKNLKRYFFSFVSLSSPHLGCGQNKSVLVNLGMTFLDKIKKDIVISQLQMTDHKNLEECFLYKLAKNDQLFWFKNIILVSSPQDKYVPYSSARIQPSLPKETSTKDKAIHSMAEMIWSKVSNDMIVRLDVDLRAEKK